MIKGHGSPKTSDAETCEAESSVESSPTEESRSTDELNIGREGRLELHDGRLESELNIGRDGRCRNKLDKRRLLHNGLLDVTRRVARQRKKKQTQHGECDFLHDSSPTSWV